MAGRGRPRGKNGYIEPRARECKNPVLGRYRAAYFLKPRLKALLPDKPFAVKKKRKAKSKKKSEEEKRKEKRKSNRGEKKEEEPRKSVFR